jgi:ATP-dependent RNA helicase RhlB
VLDLNASGQMNLMDIAFLVLDEADRMFDMGFYPDLRKLIRVVPPADRRQTMLFSATLNAWVKNLAWEYTKSPFEIEIEPETVTVEEIDQCLYHVTSDNKMRLLLGILKREQPESAIIFCNTKRYAEIAAKRLRVNGYDCEYIMGDLPQSRRLRIIEDLKAGKIRFLVATDVAARGLDIEGLAMVVNYDLPVEAENYVHRIGRTARAGKTGKAVTLASDQDVYELPAIERFIGKKIPSKIADEALYGEDKSEGMRIHTEFSESRDGRGGFASGRDDRRGGRDRMGRRERRPGRDVKPRTGERSGGGRHGVDEGRQRSGRPEQTAGGRPDVGDLARMSFDDRMALYKRKYSGGDAPPETASGAAASTASRGGRRRRRGGGGAAGGERPETQAAGNGRSQAETPASALGGKRGRRRRGRGGGEARQTAGAPKEIASVASGNAAAPKKGILGRLLGLFRKEK